MPFGETASAPQFGWVFGVKRYRLGCRRSDAQQSVCSTLCPASRPRAWLPDKGRNFAVISASARSLRWNSWGVERIAGVTRDSSWMLVFHDRKYDQRDKKEAQHYDFNLVVNQTSTSAKSDDACASAFEKSTRQVLARASSFRTVFQLRPVPRVPSFRSRSALVRRERPMPSG